MTSYQPGCDNWGCVDEVTADGDSTDVAVSKRIDYQTDLYTTQDHSFSLGTIVKIKVWIQC